MFVEFGGIDQFTPASIEKYKVALLKAREENIRIRCLVLCHPHNPLGQCYPVETLIAFMTFCQEYEIHLIVDEIYAMSVYEIPDPKTIKFESVLSLPTEKYIDPKYLHFIYGMSKDIAASGLRVGVLHSLNKELILAMSAITMFHWAGGASDKIAVTMLEDEKWMDGFLQLGRERLAARNILVRSLLDEAGVTYHHGANAGFFIWIDLRPFLRVKPDASVGDRWEAEKELLGRFIANKVYLTNGMEMSAEEPGWFRVIFAQEEWMIKEGLRR